jgi:hypothetical protein
MSLERENKRYSSHRAAQHGLEGYSFMAQSEEDKSIVPIAKKASSLGCGFAKGNKLGLLDVPELQSKTAIDIHRI